jgi:predicted kinase
MATGPLLIVLAGLPGVGKSTLAGALARATELPVFSVDPIESAMLHAGLAPSFETGYAAYLVAQALADARLALGQGAIVDAVNAEEAGKDIWRALGKKHGIPLRIVECVCTDLALHRARLEARQRGLAPTFREPSWADVEQRRLAYTAWREPVLSIDTARDEDTRARVLAWLALSSPACA